jgi:Spy/CpxP family protein refolding chaperone
MAIKSKAILALLTMAACSPLAFAQESTQGQTQAPPPQQGQAQGQTQGPQGTRQMGPPPNPMERRFGAGVPANRRSMRGPWQRRRAWRRHHRRAGFRGERGAQAFRGRMGMRGGQAGPMGMRPGARAGMGQGMGPGMGMNPGMRAGGGRGMGQGFGPGGMRPGMGRGGEMGLARFVNNPSMRQELGITDEQVTKFHSQQEDFMKAGILNRATMQVKRMELNDLLCADKPDRAAIDRKLAEVNAALAASEKTDIDHMLAMRSLLTPDQQAKMKEMMQNRMGPRGPMGPGGPGRGGRPPQPQPQKQPGGESGSTESGRTTN